MKKFSKILLALVLVILMGSPLMFAGCKKTEAKIEIHTNFKNQYVVGDNLDVTNGKLNYTNTNGKTNVVEITTQMVSSFDTTTAGSKSMIITYQGCTLTYGYTVTSNTPQTPSSNIQLNKLYYSTSSEYAKMASATLAAGTPFAARVNNFASLVWFDSENHAYTAFSFDTHINDTDNDGEEGNEAPTISKIISELNKRHITVSYPSKNVIINMDWWEEENSYGQVNCEEFMEFNLTKSTVAGKETYTGSISFEEGFTLNITITVESETELTIKYSGSYVEYFGETEIVETLIKY